MTTKALVLRRITAANHLPGLKEELSVKPRLWLTAGPRREQQENIYDWLRPSSTQLWSRLSVELMDFRLSQEYSVF